MAEKKTTVPKHKANTSASAAQTAAPANVQPVNTPDEVPGLIVALVQDGDTRNYLKWVFPSGKEYGCSGTLYTPRNVTEVKVKLCVSP